MISRVQEQIRGRIEGCWGWNSALELTVNRKKNHKHRVHRAKSTENTERKRRAWQAPPLQRVFQAAELGQRIACYEMGLRWEEGHDGKHKR